MSHGVQPNLNDAHNHIGTEFLKAVVQEAHSK